VQDNQKHGHAQISLPGSCTGDDRIRAETERGSREKRQSDARKTQSAGGALLAMASRAGKIDRQLTRMSRMSGSTVGSCWDRPSAFAGIGRRLLLGSTVGSYRRLLLGSTVGFLGRGSTASCKVSSANGNCTRRFGAAERRTFSVFPIAI
jgi:hypothetical protein